MSLAPAFLPTAFLVRGMMAPHAFAIWVVFLHW